VRFTTAGESHGQSLVSVLEGLPAGVPLDAADIDRELARRQQGYGRGRRMQIEADAVQLLAGVRGDRLADRDADSEPRLEELAGDHGRVPS
jgi:chorismate synthase